MQNRIREQIMKSGRMQKDVAKELGMTTVGLSQLAGSEMPKLETFAKIAGVLGVPVWRLFLSDEELEEIREVKCETGNDFRCPCCGAPLMVVPCDD